MTLTYQQIVDRYALVAEPTLVHDPGARSKEMTRWSVVLRGAGGTSDPLPYCAGQAYRYYHPRGSALARNWSKLTEDERHEQMKKRRVPCLFGRMTIHEAEQLDASRPIPPRAWDIISCLVCDAQCWLGRTQREFFDEFCTDMNPLDALDMWQGCERSWQRLRDLGLTDEEILEATEEEE